MGKAVSASFVELSPEGKRERYQDDNNERVMYYFLKDSNTLVGWRDMAASEPMDGNTSETSAIATATSFFREKLPEYFPQYTFDETSFENFTGIYRVIFTKYMNGYKTFDSVSIDVNAKGEGCAFIGLNPVSNYTANSHSADSAAIDASLEQLKQEIYDAHGEYTIEDIHLDYNAEGKLAITIFTGFSQANGVEGIYWADYFSKEVSGDIM